MPCAGNSAEICGGPNRLDLYSYQGIAASTTTAKPTSQTTSPAAPTTSSGLRGWTFLGCYTDSVSARTLIWAQTIPNGPLTLTVEVCQALCQNAGYTLAGVEYSVECCASNLPSPYSPLDSVGLC
jgi:glucan 1,3-beta-glucosidase